MAILAIDQGGSKTIALLADGDGCVLGTGTSYGSCHFYDGLDRAMGAVRISVDQALAQAGLGYGDITAISAGLSGANWPDEIELLENALRDIYGIQNVTVYNDSLIALRGGTDNPNAIVLCGGTGLNCAITTDTGFIKVYNNYIDDMDQGGGSLGARTLMAVFQSEIGLLPPTLLTRMALDHFGLTKVDELLLAYQRGQLGKPLKDVAFLLFEAADHSDTAALDVIWDFGTSLSRYVIAGAQQYGLMDKPIDVVLSGGIFKARNLLLQDIISACVHRRVVKASILNAEFEPVVGAMILGLEKSCDGNFDRLRANCRRSSEGIGLLRRPADAGRNKS